MNTFEPLTVKPFDPGSEVVHLTEWKSDHCGHRSKQYELDKDHRIISCRNCGTALDPYFVLEVLSRIPLQDGMRLQALQELERREAVRDGERRARAANRRHRYAHYQYKDDEPYCAVCGGQRSNPVHSNALVLPLKRSR